MKIFHPIYLRQAGQYILFKNACPRYGGFCNFPTPLNVNKLWVCTRETLSSSPFYNLLVMYCLSCVRQCIRTLNISFTIHNNFDVGTDIKGLGLRFLILPKCSGWYNIISTLSELWIFYCLINNSLISIPNQCTTHQSVYKCHSSF